jgi:antitoxin HigA-1
MPVTTKRLRTREPPHPGAILKRDVLPALHIGTCAAARALGVSRQTLHAILAQRAAVTPAMAVRIGKLLGKEPALWLRMMGAYDLWHAERDLADEVARIPTLRRQRSSR